MANSGAPTPSTAPGGALHVADTSLGKVLVDSNGMTVYLLTSDQPGTSHCSAQCLAYWPAVPAPAPSAKPAGITAMIGTTTSTNGSAMATANGWPLYTFVQDKSPGDVTGEGVASYGGVWYAVSPSGKPVKSGSGTSPTTRSAPASSYVGRGGGY